MFNEMLTKSNLKLVATILVIAGALNWLGVGLQNTNYVNKLVGESANYVFIAVGLAGIYLTNIMYFNYQATGDIDSFTYDDDIYDDIYE
jgi:uncharacterized membrane protein YuzA (DUF378 family)